MKIIFGLIIALFIIGCASMATVEVGLNDEGIVRGTLGDIAMRVTKIELREGDEYNTIWQGSKSVQVAIGAYDFVSITDNYVEINAGAYQSIRLTIDSLSFVQETISDLLVDTTLQFVATAFNEIVIDEGDEIRLVINIMTNNWFDNDSLQIKQGHNPFEGAQLKIYY